MGRMPFFRGRSLRQADKVIKHGWVNSRRASRDWRKACAACLAFLVEAGPLRSEEPP
jgi:hypothetical protein